MFSYESGCLGVSAHMDMDMHQNKRLEYPLNTFSSKMVSVILGSSCHTDYCPCVPTLVLIVISCYKNKEKHHDWQLRLTHDRSSTCIGRTLILQYSKVHQKNKMETSISIHSLFMILTYLLCLLLLFSLILFIFLFIHTCVMFVLRYESKALVVFNVLHTVNKSDSVGFRPQNNKSTIVQIKYKEGQSELLVLWWVSGNISLMWRRDIDRGECQKSNLLNLYKRFQQLLEHQQA